jgi:hypothetical protein
MTQSKKGKKEILVKSPGAFIASVSCQTVNVIPHLFNDQIMVLIIFFCQKTIIPFTGCLKKKTAQAITLLLMTQMKKVIQETKWL